MTILSSLIGVFILCFHLSCAVAASPACQDTSYGRSCTLTGRIESFLFFNETLMVGGLNSLLSFNLNLQLDKHVDLSPTAGATEHCSGFGPGQLGNDPSFCNNYLKLIERVPTGNDSHPRVMVCGTNALFPKCTLHDAQNISSYEYMTHPSVKDEGFSPYNNNQQIVATLTSTGRFFSASIFDSHELVIRFAMAPYPLQGDNRFTVLAKRDLPWLQEPTFVSSYEIGDHVYFFLRELANEVNLGKTIVYSRAIRVCKNDDGVGATPNFFRTFQKVRMSCSQSAIPGSVNLVYNYDNLQSTFLWKSPDGQQFLYGVFSSPINGPIGSAICKFSFDPLLHGSQGGLTKVFEVTKYFVFDDNCVPDNVEPNSEHSTRFVCPGNDGTQRTITEAERYQLVYNPVTAQPIYTMFGKLFTSIVVEIIDYDGSSQTIMYFATAEGDIHYLIIGNSAERHEGIIYETDTPLSDLTLHNSSDEKRYLYAITGDRILLITLGDCSRYTGCFECFDSNDAYCGWDVSTSSCKNKLTFSSPILQAALTHEDNITRVCGPRQDIPTSQTEVSTCYQSTNETTAVLTFSVTKFLGTTIGMFIGAFVIAMSVSAFIFFIYVRMSHRRVHNDVKVNDM